MGALYLSLFSGIGSNSTYAGFSNYTSLFSDPTFISALSNTAFFVVSTVPLSLAISLYCAAKISSLKSLKLQNFFTTLLYTPCISSPIAYSLFFKQLAYPNGFVSQVLHTLHVLGDDNYNVLQNAQSARIFIVIVCLWANVGFYTLILANSMKNINPSVLNAAKMDGASNAKIFVKIVIPYLKPVLSLVTILSTSSSLFMFIEAKTISDGGPNGGTLTIALYLFRKCFTYLPQYGYAAAMGIIILLISIIISFIFFKIGEQNEK